MSTGTPAPYASGHPSEPLLDPEAGLPPHPAAAHSLPERVQAVLLGSALGDAVAEAGADALDGSGATDTSAGPPLALSGTTQLVLYTLDGLLEAVEWANVGQPADETACLWLAYLRWLRTQDHPWPDNAPSPLPRWIDAEAALAVTRRPDAQTLAALSTGAMGEVERPVVPGAMGPGAMSRSVAFGLLPVGWKSLTTLTVNGAAITHGHPEAQVAAVAYALSIQATVNAAQRAITEPVRAGVQAALEVLPTVTRPGEHTISELRTALANADGEAGPEQLLERLGPDRHEAPEALAAGVWAALVAERNGGEADRMDHALRSGAKVAVENPHAVGSVAGALTGAGLPDPGVSTRWARALHGGSAVQAAGRRWCDELGWNVSS